MHPRVIVSKGHDSSKQMEANRLQSTVLVDAASARVQARSRVSLAGHAVARASARSARVGATPANTEAGPCYRFHPMPSDHTTRSNLWAASMMPPSSGVTG